MRLASRLRHSQMASIAGLLGASLILGPPPASADRDDWDDDWDSHSHHGHRHGHHRDRHHYDGDWCPPRNARPYVRYYEDDGYYYAPRPRHARYYCEPCHHWYGNEASFHYHVHHHHHVPAGVIPLVIMATVFGAVFGGY
jgi:hypothetical protein